MKRKNFSEAQIVSILQMQESGRSVKEICREQGISDATFYNWKAKYGGMEVSDVVRMKDLQEENARLKRIVANLTLEIDAVKMVLSKKYGGLTTNERR
jgi:putative transposase